MSVRSEMSSSTSNSPKAPAAFACTLLHAPGQSSFSKSKYLTPEETDSLTALGYVHAQNGQGFRLFGCRSGQLGLHYFCHIGLAGLSQGNYLAGLCSFDFSTCY